MYFLIGVWGGPRRLYAAIKFFLYTLVGSVLMLVGILTLYFYNAGGLAAIGLQGLGNVPTFSIAHLFTIAPLIPSEVQFWVFLAFFVGFAIKVPMFPFHTWLPDAHVEAPTAASVILAAVLLKMGTYGFVRLSLPLLPPPLTAAAARSDCQGGGVDRGAGNHRHHLRRAGCDGAEGYEEAGRLLVGEPHGLHHAGAFCPQ
jgi:NADH-quinone oxidoreductase subunit M